MSVKQESTTVLQTLIAKTLKGPLCASSSQGILGMELAAQVKIIPRSSLQRIDVNCIDIILKIADPN